MTMPDESRSTNRFIQLCSDIVHHRYFTNAIIVLILINTVIIGLETYPAVYDRLHEFLYLIDKIILWIFTLEVLLKLIASKPTLRFFRDNWNIFDLLIIAASHLLAGAQFVTVLRIIRILRVLRTVSVIPSLKKLINALLLTLPSLGTIMLLMSLIFYIFGVIGTTLYRNIMPEYFGSFHTTLLTLFQVVTLESWASGVMRPLLAEAPSSWLYFVSFVLVGTFVIFNLFVGVIVSNVDKANEEESEQVEGGKPEAQLERDLAAVRGELAEIKQLLQRQRS